MGFKVIHITVALAAPLGLFLGRIANFINTELYGRITEFPIAMIYPTIDQYPRHPSQIYEAILEGIILFLILLLIYKRIKLTNLYGKISGYFLILYSFFRFSVEFLREPDYQIGLIINFFSMGQILCIPIFISGIIILNLNDYKK